jgi:transposase InsO family protein
MDNNMRKELVIRTLTAAAKKFPVKGAILHSDRGSQYTSEEFKDTLKQLGMTQSLSGVDHCYDNARMESFFATLKKELLYRLPIYNMPAEQVKDLVFRYIFVYYNRIRVYTSNPDGLPPAIYRISTNLCVA